MSKKSHENDRVTAERARARVKDIFGVLKGILYLTHPAEENRLQLIGRGELGGFCELHRVPSWRPEDFSNAVAELEASDGYHCAIQMKPMNAQLSAPKTRRPLGSTSVAPR